MDLTEYYTNQAGSGLSGFEGVRYQRGNGFFGRIFKSTIVPLLKFFGKQALGTGANITEDILDGKNIKDSIKERALETGKSLAKSGVKRARKYVQDGNGKKKKSKKAKSKRSEANHIKGKKSLKIKKTKRKKSVKRKKDTEKKFKNSYDFC